MVKKAVLIGINYYNVPSARLNGCINDITNMKNTLISNYGYNENDIIMLRDDNSSYIQPTAQNIINWLYSLMLTSRYCEEIWVHYSGHGSTIRDTNGDEQSGMDSVIVPVDYQTSGVITDDLIFKLLSYSKCRTMLFFDSCNSGSICDLKWNYEPFNTVIKRTQLNNKNIQNPNIYCFSGCKDNQTSADIYDTVDKQYEGAFTDSFLLSLKQNNYNGSLIKIYKDTVDILTKRGYSQKSVLSSNSPTITYNIQKIIPKSVLLFNLKGGFPSYSPAIGETAKNIPIITTPVVKQKSKKIQITFSLPENEPLLNLGINIANQILQPKKKITKKFSLSF